MFILVALLLDVTDSETCICVSLPDTCMDVSGGVRRRPSYMCVYVHLSVLIDVQIYVCLVGVLLVMKLTNIRGFR